MSNLYGHIPESNNCLDCGYDTLPGTPNRIESERSIAAQKAAGIKTWKLPAAFSTSGEQYIVHRHVWKKAGMEEWSERGCSPVLCIDCLEKRIGRKLIPSDFAEHNFNDPNLPGTKRRLERLLGSALMEGLEEELPKELPQPSKLDLALNAALGEQWVPRAES